MHGDIRTALHPSDLSTGKQQRRQIQPSLSATLWSVIEYCLGRPLFLALVVCFRLPVPLLRLARASVALAFRQRSPQNLSKCFPWGFGTGPPHCLHTLSRSLLASLLQYDKRDRSAFSRFFFSCSINSLQNSASLGRAFRRRLCRPRHAFEQNRPFWFPPPLWNKTPQTVQACRRAENRTERHPWQYFDALHEARNVALHLWHLFSVPRILLASVSFCWQPSQLRTGYPFSVLPVLHPQ